MHPRQPSHIGVCPDCFTSPATGDPQRKVTANSSAGNVVVCVPRGLAAKVHATSGLGKVIVEPGFTKTDRDTYQSPEYDGAADRVEITAHSGAGNVRIDTI